MNGNDLKKFREKYGLTQEELAKIAGTGLRGVQGWEQNQRKVSQSAIKLLQLYEQEQLDKARLKAEDSSPPQNTAKKEEVNIDYKDKFIEAQTELIKLQKAQIEAHKNSENALQQSVSLLMNKIELLINTQKINSESVDRKIRNLQFGQAHQLAFSQYVGREILKQNQSEIERVSDTIKHGLMATLEKMDS